MTLWQTQLGSWMQQTQLWPGTLLINLINFAFASCRLAIACHYDSLANPTGFLGAVDSAVPWCIDCNPHQFAFASCRMVIACHYDSLANPTGFLGVVDSAIPWCNDGYPYQVSFASRRMVIACHYDSLTNPTGFLSAVVSWWVTLSSCLCLL